MKSNILIFGSKQLKVEMHLKVFIPFWTAILEGRILTVFFHAHSQSYLTLKQCKKKSYNCLFNLKPELIPLAFIHVNTFSVVSSDLHRNYINGTIPREWAVMELEFM